MEHVQPARQQQQLIARHRIAMLVLNILPIPTIAQGVIPENIKIRMKIQPQPAASVQLEKNSLKQQQHVPIVSVVNTKTKMLLHQ
tara:strand:- start:47 stop:301 length:255 start_codon:yes stop_codon:yes gene_type:complete